MIRARFAAALALTAAGASAPSCVSAAEATVTVALTMSADYASDTLRDEVAAIADNVPSAAIDVAPGATLSDIIVKQFGFGPSDAPETYKVIEQAILARNGLESAQRLRPGKLLVPALPIQAATRPNPQNRLNGIPKIYDYGRMKGAKPAARALDVEAFVAVRPPPAPKEESRKGAKLATLRFEWPVSLLQRMLEKLRGSPSREQFVVLDQPIVVSMGDCSRVDVSGAVHGVLSEVERAAFAQAAKGDPRRKPILFILDSGWPTAAEQARSLAVLNEFVAETRTTLRLRARPPIAPAFRPPANQHCAGIDSALAELRELDPQGRVAVAFLPLTRDQGAADLLSELVFLNRVRDAMKLNAGLDVPPPDLISTAISDAKKVVDRLPAANPECGVQTDKAVVEAVLFLGDWYAQKRGTTYVVSESWTVQGELLEVRYPTHPVGVAVAAAGNVAGRDIYQPPLDFAQRSMGHRDTIAVLNVARGAADVQCDSSIANVPDSLIPDAGLVAFDGRVTDALCGTSFAAPRVAWLVAFAEAYRSGDAAPQFWGDQLHRALVSKRHGGKGWATFWLDPVSLLEKSHKVN